MKTKLITFTKQWWYILLFLGVYFVVINLVVLNRFWQFEAFYMDHGFFDSALWQVAHGNAPLVDLTRPSLVNQLGDHFSPVMYLLSPIYFFTSKYEILLITENLFVTASAFMLFLIAKEKIKNKLMIFALLFAFCFYIGTQNAIIANYHNDLFAMLLLSLALFSLIKKRIAFFFTFLFLTMGLKENFAAIGVGLGIYLFFEKRLLWGVLLLLFSFLYYFTLIKFVMPAIAGYTYPYSAVSHTLETTITQLYSPPIKIEMTVVSFFTFGLLPLSATTFLPTILQDLFTRFVLNSGAARWDLGLHYNAILSVLLAFGAILGVERLSKYKWYQKVIWLHGLIIIAVVIVLHRFFYHGPLALVYNSAFYEHTQTMQFERKFLDSLPPSNFVMTQNSLGAHLTHRQKLMLLRGEYWKYLPDLIVLDLRDGQNPNAFWPMNEAAVITLSERLDQDPNYIMTSVTPKQLYYKKIPNPSVEWYERFKVVDQTQ